MNRENKISAVLNTYNAGQYLDEVLERLHGFDEIVVCDMESTDSTLEIARRHGCRIVTFPKGDITICEPARNTAIQSAANEWVLIVDADEIVTDELREYLYDYVNGDDPGAALMIPRVNHILGNAVSAGYPDYQCRLVMKSRCDWPATIHAKPIIDGRIDHIPSADRRLAFQHRPIRFTDYFAKINTYTDNEVTRRYRPGSRHVSLWKLITDPAFRFFKRYILKGGIARGRSGYIEARCESTYRFLTLCKIYERQLAEEDKKKSKNGSDKLQE